MSSARTLRFSPLGGGPQTLFAAEAADFVHVLGKGAKEPQQVLNFVGDVAGLAVAKDGSELIVGNGDPLYGGVMVFDRKDWRDTQFSGPGAVAGRYGSSAVQAGASSRWQEFKMPMRRAVDDYGYRPVRERAVLHGHDLDFL